MTVEIWNSDDAGFEQWLRDNRPGFIANTRRPKGGRYFRIHRAACQLPDRSNLQTVNPRTGNRYLKLTAPSIEDLRDWARTELGLEEADLKYCKVCAPQGVPSRHDVTRA